MNAGRVFIDTNVLVYAYSEGDPDKRERAEQLLRDHAEHLVLSTQVVQEFYVAGLRKLHLPRERLRAAVQKLLDLPLVRISEEHILAAMDLEDRYQISFWDGLVLAAAVFAGAHTVYTEDLNDGQQYGSVIARNPFV